MAYISPSKLGLCPLQMVHTRALPAAGRGRGRPPLGRGRGRVPVTVPRVVDETHEDVAESVVPETGNRAAEGHRPQSAQSAHTDRVSMRGSEFRDFVRRVEEAARAGQRAPDMPAQEGPSARSHTVTQVPVVQVPVAEVARVPEEHRAPRPDSWLKAFHQTRVPPFAGKVGLEVELWLGHVDSALESIECPADKRVRLVQSLFSDLAQHWWRSVRDQVTSYEQMQTRIRERFCPASLRKERLQDFMEAGYEDVPISEAIRRFQEELALLGPAAPPADQHVYLFSRRLRDVTRAYMAGLHCECLMDY